MTKVAFSQNGNILKRRYCHYEQLLINYGNLFCFLTDFSFQGLILLLK